MEKKKKKKKPTKNKPKQKSQRRKPERSNPAGIAKAQGSGGGEGFSLIPSFYSLGF